MRSLCLPTNSRAPSVATTPARSHSSSCLVRACNSLRWRAGVDPMYEQTTLGCTFASPLLSEGRSVDVSLIPEGDPSQGVYGSRTFHTVTMPSPNPGWPGAVVPGEDARGGRDARPGAWTRDGSGGKRLGRGRRPRPQSAGRESTPGAPHATRRRARHARRAPDGSQTVA